ncbi:uncharacterized protein SAZU_3989 [Streptomyces azureus]|uniref:Uncharacterized protein n=1 Tax=Streptomyces azureus TaxID=146537 RepID=A0A0K8PML0_STRAJ|nr:uncharacterized protein SAZU_3989 [Streptomyces azureus]
MRHDEVNGSDGTKTAGTWKGRRYGFPQAGFLLSCRRRTPGNLSGRDDHW